VGTELEAAMNERDAARAQAEATHQAEAEIQRERHANRMDQALQRYLAGVYFAVLGRGTDRPPDDGDEDDGETPRR